MTIGKRHSATREPEEVRMNSSQHSAAAIPQWALRTATVLAIGYLAIGLGFVSERFESPGFRSWSSPGSPMSSVAC